MTSTTELETCPVCMDVHVPEYEDMYSECRVILAMTADTIDTTDETTEAPTTTTDELIRVGSPAIVETMATANRAPFTRNRYAAAVTLSGVTYYWVAA